jgi:hypothetical protein
MNEDKASLIHYAIGMAVTDIIEAGVLINKENLIARLEHNCHESGNMMEKMANREEAELVRNSAGKVLQ